MKISKLLLGLVWAAFAFWAGFSSGVSANEYRVMLLMACAVLSITNFLKCLEV